MAAAERSLTFLFGSQGAEHARSVARPAAAYARHWLGQPDSTAELRRAGDSGALQLDRNTPAKSMDELFLTAARDGRDSDPIAFLTALDSAAQALARRPGLRLMVAVVESPPLSEEAERSLNQIIEFCQSNSVRVIVLDMGETRPKGSRLPLEILSEHTGGSLIRDPKSLKNAILTAVAATKRPEPASAAQVAPPEKLPPVPSDLPVHIRFVRISSIRSQSFGTQRRLGAGGGGGTEQSGGPNIEQGLGPARGLLLVETPFSALHFEINENAGGYQARARLTQIARNAVGKIVWQASKEVNVRCPREKIEARRSGNLYYMREVQLPAGQYTLEATVEDLLAAKSGGVREPLETVRVAPGFYVSDALLVRPFSGSADRLEADQILAYDGDAVAPLLDAAYEAGKRFDLRVYFIIYPDVYGAQPELSLELLRRGKVIGRSKLPFTDRIRETAIENSGMSSMVGEQKHAFPYMATLRGVEIGAGEYEARVIVRQGGSILTRTAGFRVRGNAPSTSAGPEQPAATEENELVDVKLPEVDPVHLNVAATLPEAEQKKLWAEAAADAMAYSSRLPNFRCNRQTRRLTAPVRSPDAFGESDSLIEELTYENGKESYRTIEVNGLKSSAKREKLKGIQSRGEFGSMMKSIFRPEISAGVKWTGRAMSGGVVCQVFDIDVPAEKSNLILTLGFDQAVAAYHGRVLIDEEARLVRRIVMQGSGLPKDFGLQSPTFSLEYEMVRIGDKDHLLPTRSVLQVRQGRRVVRNETLFRDYRKFEAESQLKFN